MLQPLTLDGQHICLLPLSTDHVEALRAAVQDGNLHELWYTNVPSPDGMEAEVERRLGLQRAGSMLPFVLVQQGTGEIVGMTSYMNIDTINRRVEIGSTWYARRLQRTAANTEAKLLLLRHAFGELRCIAVELRTHFLNQPSRRAIERIGAKLDGVLRSHIVARDGSLRDTCVYSVIASEWPAVQTHLEWQLRKPR